MSRPAHNHRIGSLPATIRRNLAEKGNWYSVKLTRGYQDLLPVAELVDLAHTWIMHQLEAERKGSETVCGCVNAYLRSKSVG